MATEIINGFPCKNCTDVDYAKKYIDPAHPKDGPFGLNNPEKLAQSQRQQAVTFGGVLAGLNDAPARPRETPDPRTIANPVAAANPPGVGALVDLRA
ncbi:MAG TPA: hypothetical protein VFW47_08830 [Phenylobacterium sp.]|nr:hypothetical protein [Phenylobacterium sp.]